MKKVLLLMTLASFLVLACDSKYETCDGVKITPNVANIQVLAASEPFYCKEMEEIWDVDAQEMTSYYSGGTISFYKAYLLNAHDDTCSNLPETEVKQEYKRAITIGELMSCRIGKAPEGDDCTDTFELEYATQDGGRLVLWHPGIADHAYISSFSYTSQDGGINLSFGTGDICVNWDYSYYVSGYQSEDPDKYVRVIYTWSK